MKSATAVHLRIHKHPTLPSPQRGGKGYHSRREQTKHLRSLYRGRFVNRPYNGIKGTDGTSSFPNNGGVHTKLLKSTDREDFWLVELCVRSLAPRPKATNTLSVTALCHSRRAGACSRRRKEYPLRHGYLRGNGYMRLPLRGGSAIGGGGECVCEIRNGGASSYSQTPHPSLSRCGSVTLGL